MSKIKLFIEPETPPRKWRDFFKNSPPFSVAIDGYVADSTKFYHPSSIANFNHHENVERLSTRSTCGQIILAIRMGFFENYKDSSGEITMNIYANDCDEDVCLSYYLLKHGYRSKNTIDPALNKLVSMVDMLDTTAGTYPFPSDLPALKNLAWIFQPYRIARLNGLLATKNAEVYKDIVSNVERRITDYICGKGEEIDLNTSYEVMYSSSRWSMIKEVGSHARIGMLSDGIKCFISAKQRQNGNWDYVIGKVSPFIKFPIQSIYSALNITEECWGDEWGGSDIIGGSPRVSGSGLEPEKLINIINETIK